MHRKLILFVSALFVAAAMMFSATAPATALTTTLSQRSTGAAQIQHENSTPGSSVVRQSPSTTDTVAKVKKEKRVVAD